MPNTVKIKRSSVASKVPATTDVQLGELAMNTTDGRLFSKKNVASVDSIVEFLSTDSAHKTNVAAATTANITLSGTQTIDGIAVNAGDRVLVKNQTTASQNGIYIVAAGAWSRSTDADTSSELAGAIVPVSSGTVNGGLVFNTNFKSSNVLGTDAMSFAQIGAIGSTTIGQSFFTLPNPSAVTFPRLNANNTVSALSQTDFQTAIGAAVGNTANTLVLRDSGGSILAANGGFSGQILTTQAWNAANFKGQIFLGGTTGNRIDWTTFGSAPPATTTRSAGTKLNFFPSVSATNVDYAIGLETDAMWHSVPSSSQSFKWYAGTTTIAALSSTALTAPSFIRAGGTAAQFLKADGSVDSTSFLSLTGGTMTGAITFAAGQGWPTWSISQGGTGAQTVSDARTNLGLGSAATLNAGSANGVATLDGSGTVPLSQIPSSLQGALTYIGTWNAASNTPTLTSAVGVKGYYYVVSTAGATALDGITDWKVGDWAIYSGSAWQKIDNTDAVTSVNGFTGTVVLTTSNVSEGGNLYYTDARARSAISSLTNGLSYSTSTGALSLTAGYGDTVNPYGTKTAAQVLAGPATGVAASPAFRALVATDIPTLNQNTTGNAANVTGTVAVANGGTGSTTASGARSNLGAFGGVAADLNTGASDFAWVHTQTTTNNTNMDVLQGTGGTAYSRASTFEGVTNGPFGNQWYSILNMQHRGGSNVDVADGQNWGTLLAFGLTANTTRAAFRTKSSGSFLAWRELVTTSIGSGTANNIPKFSGAGALTSSNITDTGTAVSMASDLFVTGEVTATDTNSAQSADIRLANNNGNGGGLALFGSTRAASGQIRSSGAYVYSNQSGGLTLHAEGNNSLYLATNGTTALSVNGSQTPTFASGASTSAPTIVLNQGSNPYSFISTADQYHGIILRGVPAAATTYGVTLGDQMSFCEFGGVFNFYKKSTSELTLQATINNGDFTTAGNISINGGAAKRLEFSSGNGGVAPPSTGSRSAGTKIVLWPEVNATNVDYAIGIDSSTLWNSVPTSSGRFRWYAGTNIVATLLGSGQFSAPNIDASQNLSYNGTLYASGRAEFGGYNYGNGRINMLPSTSGSTKFIDFWSTNQGQQVGSISTNGVNSFFNNSSDYRLKENIAPVENASDKVLRLKPCSFNYIGHDWRVDGFIAHEIQEVADYVVTGEKDAVHEDGSINAQQIDPSKLVPLLTAALQDALKRIEALEARLGPVDGAATEPVSDLN